MSVSSKNLELYFLAVIPPDPVCRDAQHLKEHFANAYQSKASLNSPPHITLHMPFKMKEKNESLLFQELGLLSISENPFEVAINGYSSFEPRVIFMNVIANEPLEKLQQNIHSTMKTKLNIFNANYHDRPFHPHLTLAFRDLKKEKFVGARKEFEDKSYEKSFLVSSFHLLKHDGKRWQVYKEFDMVKSN